MNKTIPFDHLVSCLSAPVMSHLLQIQNITLQRLSLQTHTVYHSIILFDCEQIKNCLAYFFFPTQVPLQRTVIHVSSRAELMYSNILFI